MDVYNTPVLCVYRGCVYYDDADVVGVYKNRTEILRYEFTR